MTTRVRVTNEPGSVQQSEITFNDNINKNPIVFALLLTLQKLCLAWRRDIDVDISLVLKVSSTLEALGPTALECISEQPSAGDLTFECEPRTAVGKARDSAESWD